MQPTSTAEEENSVSQSEWEDIDDVPMAIRKLAKLIHEESSGDDPKKYPRGQMSCRLCSGVREVHWRGH
jgi:hypothetical protein